MKPKLAGLRVEEGRGYENKIKKSGGFTPLVVIPWVRKDLSSLSLSVSVSASVSISVC
jgi:hypothetical protein